MAPPQTRPLKNRSQYLAKLIAFADTKPVKIVTGIRRCGKSSLLDLMIQHLLANGISPDQILKMNFESYAFDKMTRDSFHDYVTAHCPKDKRLYLFLDEPHKIPGWETVVNSLRVDLDCDIYITGSNAHMLSSEYATYLSGRYIEIKLYPLSFAEFLDFHGFIIKTENTLLGRRKTICDANETRYTLAEVFNAYLRFGGMPGIAETGLDEEKTAVLLDGIYSTVITNDILARQNMKGTVKIANPLLLKRIGLFLADNIGKITSPSKMTAYLKTEKDAGGSYHTVSDYLTALEESYLFYEAKRFDIKGKALLKTLSKYYIADLGLRNYLLGYAETDRGACLENVVYFELLRRGYDVSIGKIGDLEVDFRAVKNGAVLYVQVSESLASPRTLERELAPLQKIADNFEKLILTGDGGSSQYQGIGIKNIAEWLLDF